MTLPTPLADGPEFDAVREIFRSEDAGADASDAERSVAHEPVVGPGDDAAVLHDGTVVSTDVAVEGVHYHADWIDPGEAGERAVRAALSDLAAMGARAVAVFVNLSGRDRDVLAAAGRGVRRGAEAFGARLLGGDLARSDGPTTIGVTVLGDLGGGSPWCRSGARPGDAVWVTGDLGAAAAAVAAWVGGSEPDAAARERFVRPVPRFGVVDVLRAHLSPHAAIDLSDGIAADARQIASASGVRLVIEAARVPISPAVREGRSFDAALRLALGGGEDYELLLVGAPSEGVEATVEAATGVALTRIGRVVEGEGAVLDGADGSRRALEGGFGHWATS